MAKIFIVKIAMNNEQTKSIEMAIAMFDPNYPLRCQVFSFAFLKTRLVAVGRNKPKTHSLNKKNPLRFRDNGKIHLNKNLCAEADLFIKIRNMTNIPFNKIKIFNVRVDNNKKIRISKPCGSCESLLRVFSPKSLYYTNQDGEWEKYI